MRIQVVTALLVALASVTATARAADEDENGDSSSSPPASNHPFDFTDRPLSLDGVIGFGTPVGILGVVLQYDLASWLSVGAGAGTNVAGLQLAALTRVRPFVWKRSELALAVEIGGAFSSGEYAGQFNDYSLDFDEVPFPGEQQYDIDRVNWLQFDVGFEMKTRSGFHLILAQGVASPLNPDSGHCVVLDTKAPVACDEGLIQKGNKPTFMPTVFTAMIGFSL